MLAEVNGCPPCVGVDVDECPQCVHLVYVCVCEYVPIQWVHGSNCIWLPDQGTMSRMWAWKLAPFGVGSRYSDNLVNTAAGGYAGLNRIERCRS